MKNDYTFVTLFPHIENIHIVKDVGMIPYSMNKYFGYDSKIVVFKNVDYPYLENEVSNLNKIFFPYKHNKLLNCIGFLNRHSKEIDVLHLYHIGTKLTWVNIYKYFKKNKNGLIYIHMDENPMFISDDILGVNKKNLKSKIKSYILRKYVFSAKNRQRILFGLQNKTNLNSYKNQFPFDNIKFIPNGYEVLDNSNKKIEKENIILFVGRVGSPEKRTDILLDGYKLAFEKLKNWKLKIIGPVSAEFKQFIDKFISENKNVAKNIEFTGPIYNRRKLNEEYKRAKIFCLTSDYESFGLVTLEALANGCAILSSNLDASREIINDCEYGKLFECGNVLDFSNKLVEICNDIELQKHVIKNCDKYIKSKYSYNKSLKVLDEWINENK